MNGTVYLVGAGPAAELKTSFANDADTYARPHDIDVGRDPAQSALAARFVHGSAIGPVARLEFALEPSAQTVNVELPRERFRVLSLRPGDIAYLTPTRLHQFAAPG